MTNALPERTFLLEPSDSERLSNLAGPFDGHLRQIELRLGVEIANRGNIFRITGRDEAMLSHPTEQGIVRAAVPLGTPIDPGDTIQIGERWF